MVRQHGEGCMCYDCVTEWWAATQSSDPDRRREGRRNYRNGPPIAKNPANQASVNELFYKQQAEKAAARKKKREDSQKEDRRLRQYRQATSRPEGVQEAGNTSVGNQPGYYEDGGTTGRPGHRDRYYGPNGPFGSNHHHDGSKDGGETWENYH